MFRRRWIRRLLQQIAPARREHVSAQYWEELHQLLEQGEISPEIAKKVQRDMFEPQSTGAPRILTDDAWQIYLDDRRANLDVAMARATAKPRKQI